MIAAAVVILPIATLVIGGYHATKSLRPENEEN